ncbi:hypothetical protein GPECTOR_26g528 [Gonium pectorale]|uniref:Uncharacterized protein n=1 Tax=Gonium pectorale TaxID=33097 RepID=A0A150GG97_GONPE|nr:hypothetical protein GPECTOR_26g528 [Gonium pectorale]|eukprot:KXZ48625.1 hypothetical protein GPECTOR_26g528 [Gonium pectorale]
MSSEDVQQTRDEVAQEKFGKKFEELSSMEKIQVGGTIGGRTRGDAGGGDHKEHLDQVAQEKFGKTFDELEPMERIQAGGTVGGQSGGLYHGTGGDQ